MEMEVMSSTLNPNAPIFVPLAYRTVEDFSDQWWHLVHSSPSFRHYWLLECFQDPQYLNDFDFDLYDEDQIGFGAKQGKDLVSLGLLKWPRSGAASPQPPRHVQKAPKFVKPKFSPRAIHQPR